MNCECEPWETNCRICCGNPNSATWIMMLEETRQTTERTKRFIMSLDPAQAEDYKESLINNYSVVGTLNILKQLEW